MKYLLLLAMFPCGMLNAQKKTEFFTFDPAEQRIRGSLYNSIDFLDLRRDTTYLGVVQVGMVNTKARVVPKQPLQEQFQTLLASLVDSDAKQGRLLLTFRRFTFMERTTATKETGFFFVRADLYQNNNEQYRWISTLDTIIQFNGMDVTQKLLRKGEKLVTAFLTTKVTEGPSSPRTYSLLETIKIDSLQKAELAVYNTEKYTDGLYETYESFRDQKPSTNNFTTDIRKEKLKDVFVPINNTGGLKKITSEHYFAVVYKGIPYVVTDDGYFPLEKRNDDFYYSGVVKSFSIGPALMFGLMGAMLMGTKHTIGEFKMDHINGSFLYFGKLRED